MTDSNAVRRLVSLMPDFWHAEAKSMVARHIVNTNNNTMALDARPASLDADINRFFRGDQMPMTPPSAAMPRSLSPDNYTGSTGGIQYHRRNGNASDQPATAEELLNAFSALPEEVQLQVFQALASFYRVDVAGEEPPAEDQEGGSSMRLPAGPGVTPGQFFQGQQTLGTFSERDPLTSPRATADQDPAPIGRLPAGMVARELSRRGGGQAEDRRLALDARIRRRIAAQQGFASRFGALTAHVEVWR